MAIVDYRFDPFNNVLNIKRINNEQHVVPTSSPYTVRLNEVPQKTDPTTLQVKFSTGAALAEVAAQPAQGQYWPDYNTTEHGVADWNTGSLLFSAADAGKTVLVSYNGMGTLTDDRLADMLEINVTSSTQPERDAIVTSAVSYDRAITTGVPPSYYSFEVVRGRIRTHKGLGAGKYSLKRILQHLVNLSHTQEYVRETYRYNCDCDCNCGDDM